MAGKENELGPTGQIVAWNIRRLRGDLSFAELSRRLSERGRAIPALGLRRIEAGERRVDVDDLMAFAHVFGVNPNALFLPNSDTHERIHQPTGAKEPRNLKQIWDWADGRRPYLLDTPEAYGRFAVDARPPGRDTVDYLVTSLEAVDEVKSEMARVQATLDQLLEERRRPDGDN